MSNYELTLNRCDHGVEMLSLENRESAGGVRLLGPKCCGLWHEVKAWPLNENRMRSVVREFEDALCDLEEAKTRKDSPHA